MPKIRIFSAAILAALVLGGCATPSYTAMNRIDCVSNLSLARIALREAARAEATYGVDVDAYDDADKFALWSNIFLASFNALSAGRRPDMDDACFAVNQTADFTRDGY